MPNPDLVDLEKPARYVDLVISIVMLCHSTLDRRHRTSDFRP
jgi:hypothetical protein